MKLKKNDLVEIEWDDTFASCSWYTEAAANGFPIVQCKSVGYFINKDKKCLRLSATIQLGRNGERDVAAIPVGCITKIRRLKH